MQIYLTISPQQALSAATYNVSLACMAYHIGSNSTLLRRNTLLQNRGGLLLISHPDAPLVENPQWLCEAVLRECSRRSYEGVFLNFTSPPRQDLIAFTTLLDRALHKVGKKLYLPSGSYLQSAPEAIQLVDTALSGGNLQEHLTQAAALRKGRVALRMERIQMDFCLPARSGTGTHLTQEALSHLMSEKNPSIYFSPDLCSRYFTYQNHGETHFVLFDDAETLKRKLRLGADCGFSTAFFTWSEIQDIAQHLLK